MVNNNNINILICKHNSNRIKYESSLGVILIGGASCLVDFRKEVDVWGRDATPLLGLMDVQTFADYRDARHTLNSKTQHHTCLMIGFSAFYFSVCLQIK